MSTSGGSSGGGVTFAKQTAATPFGAPGLFALSSALPVDGGWMDFAMSATTAVLTAGAKTDDTFQSQLASGTSQSQVVVYNDGALTGNVTLQCDAAAAQISAKAHAGQTGDLLILRDNANAVLVEVSGDAKVGVFGATAVVQQANIPDAAGGAVIDVQARAAVNAALALLKSYGWMHT